MATTLTLEEVVQDKSTREAFGIFLTGCFMFVAECLEMWLVLEEFRENNKKETFFYLCETYINADCMTPINLSYDNLAVVRKVYAELKEDPTKSTPENIFLILREELWTMLATSCLPPFLQSDLFREFEQGKRDSSSDAYSRVKAEWFFGVKIEGKLQRIETVKVIRGTSYAPNLSTLKRMTSRGIGTDKEDEWNKGRGKGGGPQTARGENVTSWHRMTAFSDALFAGADADEEFDEEAQPGLFGF